MKKSPGNTPLSRKKFLKKLAFLGLTLGSTGSAGFYSFNTFASSKPDSTPYANLPNTGGSNSTDSIGNAPFLSTIGENVSVTPTSRFSEKLEKSFNIEDFLKQPVSIESEKVLLDQLDKIPERIFELIEGSAWFGPHTWLMQDRLLVKNYELEAVGIKGLSVTGYDKGSLYLKGSDNKIYEVMVGERRATIAREGQQLEWEALLRSLALRKIQLDREGKVFFELPATAVEYLSRMPVTGEPGSNAPALLKIADRLTLLGDAHPDLPKIGFPALRSLDYEGKESILPSNFIEAFADENLVVRYTNYHNLTKGTLEFLNRQYADQWVAVMGLPVSDPYWLEAVIRSEKRWITWQAFERGAVTFNPMNRFPYTYEGDLSGNLLIASLTKGSINLPFSLKSLNSPRPSSTEPAKIFKFNEVAERQEFKDGVGWAYSALNDRDAEGKLYDLHLMKEKGLNTVYIGHANPARLPLPSGGYGVEPGLSHAVYYSLVNESPYKKAAWETLSAVLQTLSAAQQVGLKVVLPVGYQIQMGDEWNSKNRSVLRKKADGTDLVHWGDAGTQTASPFSPEYREEILKYYKWVNETIIQRFGNTVVAVNLADEPMGTDFSHSTKQEFSRIFGKKFDDAGPWTRGKFLADFIANYASFSARAWQAVNPSVWSLMSHHIEREVPWFPDIENIFLKTPSSYIFSADTHWHDDIPKGGITDREFLMLRLILRTMGWLSNVYNKNLLPWTGVNAWSMAYSAYNAQQGVRYGRTPEALQNLEAVQSEIKRMGGKISMIMAWGYNIRNQFTPDLNQTIEKVSQKMAEIKTGLSDQTNAATFPDVILAYSRDRLYRKEAAIQNDQFVPMVAIKEALEDKGKNFEALMRGKSVILAKEGCAFQTALELKPDVEIIDLF